MLQSSFERVYTKFKLHFYQKVFERIQGREMTLTTVEAFCMEIIHALRNPTVNEFAKTAGISSPNAAYKINNLIKKGYVTKVQSMEDKREYRLVVTERYMKYYNISNQYVSAVVERMKERFTPDEQKTLEKMLNVIDEELMTEISLPEDK